MEGRNPAAPDPTTIFLQTVVAYKHGFGLDIL